MIINKKVLTNANVNVIIILVLTIIVKKTIYFIKGVRYGKQYDQKD